MTGLRWRRLAGLPAILAATAAVLLGCSVISQPVDLLTGKDPGVPDGSCFTSYGSGVLSIDPKYGTAILIDPVPADAAPVAIPVLWPPGYMGRRSGNVIEVLDETGVVVAVTGRHYQFAGGGSDASGTDVFVACSFVAPKLSTPAP
ncbi:MAG TPA: hypothetical protein VJ850_08075 [Candidatus Limnocylindrales bacterium]|nr:hypothetical protein [Candidatus Limnocylindrales bacterium]